MVAGTSDLLNDHVRWSIEDDAHGDQNVRGMETRQEDLRSYQN
jgi:hypothetical protein